MNHLQKKCQDYIVETQISPLNFCKMYESALKLQMNHVISMCRYTLKNETKAVLQSDQFAFAKLSTVKSIVESDSLNIDSEIEMIQAIIRWGTAECSRNGIPGNGKNIRECIEPLLKDLRFLTLTLEEFHSFLNENDVFTATEACQINTKLCRPKSELPLPPFLCLNCEKRIIVEGKYCGSTVKNMEHEMSSKIATNEVGKLMQNISINLQDQSKKSKIGAISNLTSVYEPKKNHSLGASYILNTVSNSYANDVNHAVSSFVTNVEHNTSPQILTDEKLKIKSSSSTELQDQPTRVMYNPGTLCGSKEIHMPGASSTKNTVFNSTVNEVNNILLEKKTCSAETHNLDLSSKAICKSTDLFSSTQLHAENIPQVSKPKVDSEELYEKCFNVSTGKKHELSYEETIKNARASYDLNFGYTHINGIKSSTNLFGSNKTEVGIKNGLHEESSSSSESSDTEEKYDREDVKSKNTAFKACGFKFDMLEQISNGFRVVDMISNISIDMLTGSIEIAGLVLTMKKITNKNEVLPVVVQLKNIFDSYTEVHNKIYSEENTVLFSKPLQVTGGTNATVKITVENLQLQQCYICVAPQFILRDSDGISFKVLLSSNEKCDRNKIPFIISRLLFTPNKEQL